MLRGMLGSLWTLVPVVAYLVLLGGALRLVLARAGVALPRSGALTVGVGAGVGSAGVALAWALADRATAAIPVLGVLAVLAVLAVLLPWSPLRPVGPPERRRLLGDLLPTLDDVLALVAALTALAPLFRFGRTFWTLGTNDYPSYVASAQYWIAPAEFVARHQDSFGRAMIGRAGSEKPMTTGLLVLVERVSGVPAYALLSPLMLLGLFLVAGVVMALVRAAVPRAGIVGRLVALLPFFSVVPTSRVLDAQVGQVVAVALAAVVLALLTTLPRDVGRVGRATAAVVAGLVLAACLGSNVTLLLGSGLTVLGLGIWLVARSGGTVRATAVHWLASGAVAAAVSVPFLDGYLLSVRGQTAGTDGFDIPMPSPLALLGLQTSLQDTPAGGRAVFQWVVVIVVTALVILAFRRSWGPTWTLVSLTVANGAVIIATAGANGYGTHKWLALTIWLVVPFLLAVLVEAVAGVTRPWSVATAGVLTVGAAATCVGAAHAVWLVVPHELLDLDGDPRIEGVGPVNVDLGNQYETSIAALVLDEPTVVTGFTYARPSPREGDWVLTRTSALEGMPVDETIVLNDAFALADVDDVLGIETVRFDASEDWTRVLLDGSWHEPEAIGTWSSAEESSVTFEVAPELRGRDVVVTLTGARFATAELPRELTLAVDGGPSVTTTFTDHTQPRETVLTVPADVVSATGGELTLRIETPDPISPRAAGVGQDGRTLGYLAMSLSVAPGAGS